MRLIQLYFDEDAIQGALIAALGAHSFNMGDYRRLHQEWLQAGRSHAGLILARQQTLSVGEQLRRILRIRAAISAD